jgi:hypothetical protein
VGGVHDLLDLGLLFGRGTHGVQHAAAVHAAHHRAAHHAAAMAVAAAVHRCGFGRQHGGAGQGDEQAGAQQAGCGRFQRSWTRCSWGPGEGGCDGGMMNIPGLGAVRRG